MTVAVIISTAVAVSAMTVIMVLCVQDVVMAAVERREGGVGAQT